MKKIFTFTLSMIVASCMAVSAAPPTKISKTKPYAVASMTGQRMFGNAHNKMFKAGLPMANNVPLFVTSNDPVATQTTPFFGWIDGPDGTQWYYTQTFEYVAGSTSNFSKSTITMYDSNNKAAGTVNVTIPDTISVNDIQTGGMVTTKLFDRDESTKEIVVMIHLVGNKENNYKSVWKSMVYQLDGDKKYEYDGNFAFFDASKGWNTYQRLLLIHSGEGANDKGLTYVDVLAPGGWGSEGPVIEHTFTTIDSLTNYSNGSTINCYDVDGKPYYVLSNYEKPWNDGFAEDGWYPKQREKNNYIVKVYDKSYNMVDSIAVPVVKPEDESVTYRNAAFGAMDNNDFSNGYYTGDGKPNFVITFADLTTKHDGNEYTFQVYDSEGKYVKTIADKTVDTWFHLAPIKGQSDQMAFLQQDGNNQQIKIVEMPSCNPVITIPSVIDGQQTSTTFDRYPKGNSYQYVMNMQASELDADNNVIALINWYNPDLTLDHTAKFNLGQNGEYFTPLINNLSLNPYVFDTDDELEYIYIAKKRSDDGKTVDNVLEIANEDGSILKSFKGDGNYVLRMPTLVQMTSDKNQLHIAYYSYDSQDYKIDYYDLPFEKFTKGGDGTAANPYLVSTAGDMLQIKTDPKASYKLVNDIDLNTTNADWAPINEFSGTLDGDGHYLSNLTIESSESDAGLIGMAGENSQIKNLTFVSPSIKATEDNSNIGVVAGEAISAKISNVHVVDANITSASEDASATTGGLVGNASLYSEVAGSSFSGTINLPGSQSVGGILGNIRTSTDVTACYAEGTFTAQKKLGGIAGVNDADSKITNSHANVTLTAENTIGGIVGDDGRGSVSLNIAEGTITATQAPKWGGLALGGIAGSLASDWSNSTNTVVGSNIAIVNITRPANTENDGTIHRIVGTTIANEDYEEGQTPYTELGLANNYAAKSVTIDGKAVESDDDKSVEGATKEVSAMTKELFTKLGFTYGDTITAPWKGETGLPVLYFEKEAKAITLANNSLTIEPNHSATTTATVYGTSAEEVDAISADAGIADVEITNITGNTVTLKVTGKKVGQTTVVLSSGKIKTVLTVKVTDNTTNIDNVTTEKLSIQLNGRNITAVGATAIEVYSLNGTLASKASGNSLTATTLANGVYVVVATAADGSHTTAKIVVK